MLTKNILGKLPSPITQSSLIVTSKYQVLNRHKFHEKVKGKNKFHHLLKEFVEVLFQGSLDQWNDAGKMLTYLVERNKTAEMIIFISETQRNLFKFLPFSVFLGIPFAEVLLPFYLYFFPNALPTTYIFDDQYSFDDRCFYKTSEAEPDEGSKADELAAVLVPVGEESDSCDRDAAGCEGIQPGDHLGADNRAPEGLADPPTLREHGLGGLGARKRVIQRQRWLVVQVPGDGVHQGDVHRGEVGAAADELADLLGELLLLDGEFEQADGAHQHQPQLEHATHVPRGGHQKDAPPGPAQEPLPQEPLAGPGAQEVRLRRLEPGQLPHHRPPAGHGRRDGQQRRGQAPHARRAKAQLPARLDRVLRPQPGLRQLQGLVRHPLLRALPLQHPRRVQPESQPADPLMMQLIYLHVKQIQTNILPINIYHMSKPRKVKSLASLNPDQEDAPHNLFQLAIEMYQQSSTLDDSAQIEQLIPIISNIEYFKASCPQDSSLDSFIRSILTKLKYEHFPENHCVFHLGDPGDKFYLILSGTVMVFIPRDAQVISEEEQLSQQRIDHLRQRKSTLLEDPDKLKQNIIRKQSKPPVVIDQELSLFNLSKRDSRRSSQYFTHLGVCRYQSVITLSAGRIFGEQALTTDKPRGATIISHTPLQVLSLTKEDYKKVFDVQIQATKRKIDFFKAIFPNASRFNISKFMLSFHERNYIQNQILWKEQEPSTFFLLIQQGLVQLEKQVPDKTHVPTEKDKLSTFLKKEKKISVQIATIASANFVGHYEVLHRKKRNCTCKVIEPTKAYLITTEDFNILKKVYPEVLIGVELRLENHQWEEERTKQIIETNKQNIIQSANLKEVYPERKGAQEIEQKFSEVYKVKVQGHSKLPNIKNKFTVIQGNNKPVIRSGENVQINKKILVDVNETICKNLQRIQEENGVEQEFNMLKLTNNNIQKALQIRVQKYYENYQPAKPKGETPHFSNKSWSSLRMMKTSRMFKEDCQEMLIHSYLDPNKTIQFNTINKQGSRIINPQVMLKSKELMKTKKSFSYGLQSNNQSKEQLQKMGSFDEKDQQALRIGNEQQADKSNQRRKKQTILRMSKDFKSDSFSVSNGNSFFKITEIKRAH